MRLVCDAVEDYRSTFIDRGLTLEAHAPGEPLWVDGDAKRLDQIVGNLLQNASKFTDPGGHAEVRVERGRDAIVRVRDDGIGIGPDLIHGLFEPFVQAEKTLARARGGLGVGLALVKRLVVAHGGTVDVRSAGEGKGSEFIVALPLAADSNRPGAARAAPGPRRRVLVIEDSTDTAASLRDLLELNRHEVHVARNGFEGVTAALSMQPDVVLCDIGLPGTDGHEVAPVLRRRALDDARRVDGVRLARGC